MNFNLPRWVKGSIVWHFIGFNNVFGEYLYPDPFVAPDGKDAWGVLRFSGLTEEQESHNVFRYTIGVSLLVTTRKKQSDIYFHDQKVGNYTYPFTPCIMIFKIGDGPYDTIQIIDSMTIKDEHDGGQGLIIHHYGQLDKSVDLLQSTIEATYEMVVTSTIDN